MQNQHQRDLLSHQRNQKYLEYQQYYYYDQNYVKRVNKFYEQLYIKTGRWTVEENIKYYAFLKKFSDIFQANKQRRQFKVFKILSQFIKTRSSNQCKNHHIKMIKNRINIKDILTYLQKKFSDIDEKAEKYIKILQNFDCNCSFEVSKDYLKNYSKNIIQEQKLPVQTKIQSSIFQDIEKQYIKNLKTEITQEKNKNLKNQNYIAEQEYSDFENTKKIEPKFQDNISQQYKPSQDFYNQYLQNVKECHNLFINWWNKFSTVMQMEKKIF